MSFVKAQIIYTEEDKCFMFLSAYYVLSLSQKIKNSLEWYTENYASNLNRKIKNREKLTETETEHLNNIEKAFESCPLYYKSFTMYRGTNYPNSSGIFLSCSTDVCIARNFGTLHTVNCEAGVKMLNLESISAHWNEKECLLDKSNVCIAEQHKIQVISNLAKDKKLHLVRDLHESICQWNDRKDKKEYNEFVVEIKQKHGWKDDYIWNTFKSFAIAD